MRRSQKQLEASRANGKKSAGPVTPEGKARSARNGTRHGLTSKVVLLACEDPAEYNRLLAAYREFWQPATQPESDLVDDYVAARWRLNRTLALEAASIDLEMDRRRDGDREKYTRIDEPTRCALAVHALIDTGKGLAHFSRYEARLRRAMRRALEELRELKNVTDEPTSPSSQ